MRTVKELLAAFLIAASLILYVGQGRAAPVAEAGGDGGVIVQLTDEPCALPAVANLKNRATWTEAGKVTEGCWAAGRGLVMLYFADKTVVAVPAQAFSRTTGV